MAGDFKQARLVWAEGSTRTRSAPQLLTAWARHELKAGGRLVSKERGQAGHVGDMPRCLQMKVKAAFGMFCQASNIYNACCVPAGAAARQGAACVSA